MVSKMLVHGSNRRSFGIDAHAGLVITGLSADGRQIVNRAREEAHNYKDTYGHRIVPSVLATRLSLYMHYFTIYGSLRPFGATAIIAAYDEDMKTPEMYMLEPSGVAFRYFGCAAGKGAQAAKTELEKILGKNSSLTCVEATKEIAKMYNMLYSFYWNLRIYSFLFYYLFFLVCRLYTIRDLSRDKPFEIEMGWLCEASNFKYSPVPANLL